MVHLEDGQKYCELCLPISFDGLSHAQAQLKLHVFQTLQLR